MNYKQKLTDFCNELMDIEDEEFFRPDRETGRYEMASEIADKAREILRELEKCKT